MRHTDCCNNEAYENYYLNQVGNGEFLGAANQQGYGLGNIFGAISRAISPLVKNGAKIIGKQALTNGIGLALDVLEGKNIRQAAIDRAKAAGSNLLQQAVAPKRKSSANELSTFSTSHGIVSTPKFL